MEPLLYSHTATDAPSHEVMPRVWNMSLSGARERSIATCLHLLASRVDTLLRCTIFSDRESGSVG
jgi:hypothetical protein